MSVATPPRDPALERIDRELADQFGTEVRILDTALARFQEAERGLLRPDGSKRYADEEHGERIQGLLASLDDTLEHVAETATTAIAKARGALATLDTADPLDSLNGEGQARAAARRDFIKEDAASLPLARIAAVVTGALASDDRPLLVLWHRYLGLRLEAERQQGRRVGPHDADAAAFAVFRDLEARVLGDPEKRQERRRALEQRISNAKVLEYRARSARSTADGTAAASLDEMRRRYAALF